MEEKRMKMKRWTYLAACAGVCFLLSGSRAYAAQQQSVTIPMPGFVVEQWAQPRPMSVNRTAQVRSLAQEGAQPIGSVEPGQMVNAWGQTDNGWYFIECGQTLGYVRYEAAAPVDEATLQLIQEQNRQAQLAAQAAAAAAEEAASAAAKEAARQAQIAAAAQIQPAVAAGVVFIGDSRMVTLKEDVEEAFGVCPAAVVAQNGSRYEWFHDSAIPQADRIIGQGSRVIINMGVNDLSDASKYAQDVNYWGAVWTQRGATVYYASVNPVWANSHNITQERVDLFNSTLRSQLIPQVIWLDSSGYLMQAGVHATDGLHYKADTNLVLYNYYMTAIGAI